MDIKEKIKTAATLFPARLMYREMRNKKGVDSVQADILLFLYTCYINGKVVATSEIKEALNFQNPAVHSKLKSLRDMAYVVEYKSPVALKRNITAYHYQINEKGIDAVNFMFDLIRAEQANYL